MATNGSDQTTKTNSRIAPSVHDSQIFKYAAAMLILILVLLGMILNWMYIKVVSADKEFIKIFFYKLSVYMCYTDIAQAVVIVVLVWTVTVEEDVKVRSILAVTLVFSINCRVQILKCFALGGI